MSVEARTGYEASKLARERYAEYYSHHHDMSMAGLRFSRCIKGSAAMKNTKASSPTRSPSSPTRSPTARLGTVR